jgi:hypothetical protein
MCTLGAVTGRGQSRLSRPKSDERRAHLQMSETESKIGNAKTKGALLGCNPIGRKANKVACR